MKREKVLLGKTINLSSKNNFFSFELFQEKKDSFKWKLKVFSSTKQTSDLLV